MLLRNLSKYYSSIYGYTLTILLKNFLDVI